MCQLRGNAPILGLNILKHGFLISISLKIENSYKDSFCVSVETSLKNEIEVMSIVPFFVSSSLKNETSL